MKICINNILFLFLLLSIALLSNTNALNLKARKEALSESETQNGSYYKQTNWNDYGEGNIWYLDRHDINCDKGVVQGFHLQTQPNLIRYNYKCRDIPNVDNSIRVTKETQKGPILYTGLAKVARPYWSTQFLDRHYVKCDEGFALEKFKLMRNGEEIYYQFNCAKVNKYGNCRTINSVESLGGPKGGISTGYNYITTTNYLDRQQVFCSDNQFFTGFRLSTRYTDDSAFYTYYYDICDFY